MTVPEWIIVALAAIELLAVAGMGLAALMLYRRVRVVASWAKPAAQEAQAVAARAKATSLATRDRVTAFSREFQKLGQHVQRKVKTTTRLAREVVHPDPTPLRETARTLEAAQGIATRLSRLREAGKIAAGNGSDHGSRK